MKKYFSLLLLTLLLASCGKNQNSEVVVSSGEIQKQETIKTEFSEITKTNTWESVEIWSGIIKNDLLVDKEKYNFENINAESKIYDAYISDETEKVSFDSLNNISDVADKNSLVKISNTIYYKDNKNLYLEDDYASLVKVNSISDFSKFKGILPYKWFTWSSNFVTDGKNIFNWYNKIDNWDITTFKFKIFSDGFKVAGDSKNIYDWYIVWWDIISFQYIWWDYYKDNNNVYLYHLRTIKKIEWANAKKFEIIDENSGYSKDENNVYYRWEKIEWANPKTFEIIDENSIYSKDKNNVYYRSEKLEWINPNWFDLEKYLKERQASN